MITFVVLLFRLMSTAIIYRLAIMKKVLVQMQLTTC